MASPRDEAPAFVHGGFAVVRTPLLPVETFLEWSRRTRDALAGDAAGERADGEAALQVLRDMLAEPGFREALRVASADLSREIDVWLAGARTPQVQRLVHTLARYLSRAAYRCTPFGLFAGCSALAVGDHTRLALEGRAGYRRRSRIDMDHLAELSRVLGADAECRRRVPLRANTSVAEVGGRLHYVETRYAGRSRLYHLTAADPTPEILDALERGRRGTSFAELSGALRAAGYEAEEVEEFVTELLDAQLLVPDLEPIVSGADAALALADTLEAAGCAPEVAGALREVCARLRAADAADAPDYAAAVAPLRALPVEVDEARAVQVDLYKPAPSASLGRAVVDDAVAAMEILSPITPGVDPLAAFAARFEARYETREVPLAEALDEEVGIGMPAVTSDDGVMRRHSEARARREGVLAELRCRAAHDRSVEVRLTEEDLERLRWSDPRPAPDAVAFFGSIVAASDEAVDRGEYRLIVGHVSGPSGARLLGRFAHLDPALEAGVQAHVAAEAALQPDATFAEIIHLPQGRIGNVIARPTLRADEIHYLGRGSAADEHRIDPADLRVSVARGQVRLRSERLGREVHPRLSTAHNYHAPHELPLYRFLCALQDHRSRTGAHWDWGAQRNAPFLPRVTHGRLTLSGATWNLSAAEVRRLSEAAARGDHADIRAWWAARELPRFALLVQSDNRLAVDFENPVSALVFARLLRGQDSATVVEAPHLSEAARCIRGPEGSFTNEIILPLVRRVPAAPAADAPAPRATAARTVVRAHPPGSEWLYAKLYCGRGSADALLRGVVAPALARARAELAVLGWFFIRYADTDFHIRFRVRVPAGAVPRLVEIVGAAAAPAVASGRVARLVFDTYLPEVERYGGPEGIGIAEAVFGHDSDAALALIAAVDHHPALGEVPRELAALAGIDQLLRDAEIPVEGRIALLSRGLGAVPDAVRHARGMEFRAHRAAITQILTAEPGDGPAGAVRSLLASRSERMRPLLQRLARLDAAGELHRPLADVVLSLSHMWVNRVAVDGVAVEPALYDRLVRAYRSVAGRARAGAAAPA